MTDSAPPAILSLRLLLTIVAVVEALYALVALLVPPNLMLPLTGWMLSADGHWVTKLLGAALGFQAYVAWAMRDRPHLPIVTALAVYQLAAATIDWVMWAMLAGDGIFATELARASVVASIVLHYGLGILLIVAIRRHRLSRVAP